MECLKTFRRSRLSFKSQAGKMGWNAIEERLDLLSIKAPVLQLVERMNFNVLGADIIHVPSSIYSQVRAN